ncbi:hypothetical protein P4637_15590 [Halalkalibacterium halodurans]|uniref:BH0862 protein n=1 Tax=Halalkalibacterium halodurans (strain ATCC BAA-125 / DSM 18197 / FERM 7344 / JCM 9153 / C-125) TaxID=272558 RepID=Q9KEJ0_HALH5|nr:hypothetical protein [Halalkalibacterium halodurans]MDY7221359.1 hypothetical protein [Halalkalibacterium halodurans]MDY7240598.1 hypothetical protein [Halalkalibacterium halodurans]MED3648343.1 hypothetical protein [Halalkalibacterium halodurans]MED4080775.1 hypothetical protein [Halalkalibacterium halodurans]MED4086232.1 hypothetical protein [Halalkalibacterium halodurans]
MKKRSPQKDKAMTNNKTPTESMFNENVASEMVDNGSNRANAKGKK